MYRHLTISSRPTCGGYAGRYTKGDMRIVEITFVAIFFVPVTAGADYDCSDYSEESKAADPLCVMQADYEDVNVTYQALMKRFDELERIHSSPSSIRYLRKAVSNYRKTVNPYVLAYCDLSDYERYFPGFWGSGSSDLQVLCAGDKTKELSQVLRKILRACSSPNVPLDKQCIPEENR